MTGDRIQSLLPLRAADYHILFVLLDGPRHGYAISRQIREATDGLIALEAANLQRTIRKLIRRGLVEESTRRPAPEDDDRRRRYFAITPLGRQVAAADAARMRQTVAEAESKALLPKARTVR